MPLHIVDIDPGFLKSVPSLTKLKVQFSPNAKLLENLHCLTSLERLAILSSSAQQNEFEKVFGVNLQILENFPKLAYIKLSMFLYLNPCEIQTRYPSIRFRWLFGKRLIFLFIPYHMRVIFQVI